MPSTAPPSSTPVAQAAKPSGDWTYSEFNAPLQDAPAHLASVNSSNEIHLNAPYSDVKASLVLRRGPGYGYDSLIRLMGDGQFTCSFDACSIAARFDGGPVIRFPATDQSQDGSTGAIFIDATPRLVSLLKRSKTAVFDLQFFEAGDQEVSFNVAGLYWPDPTSARRRIQGADTPKLIDRAL